MDVEALNGRTFEFSNGLKDGKTGESIKEEKLKEVYKNFEKGAYLGDFRVYFEVTALNVKDYQRFREISKRDFADDDWRTLKFMIKLYEAWEMLIGLTKHLRRRPDKAEEKDGGHDKRNKDTVAE